MADTDDAAAAARAAEQTRLRKERREAKIRAGGTSRLNKITGLGGGSQKEHAAQPIPAPSITSPSAHANPEEVNILQRYYAPQTSARAPLNPQATANQDEMPENMLSHMLMAGGGGTAAPGPCGMDDSSDPTMRMMMQMVAGGPDGGGNPLAASQISPVQTIPSHSAALWRVLHAIFALSLGLYMASQSHFTGNQTSRNGGVSSEDQMRRNFVWVFATAEAVLLTMRFLVQKGGGANEGVGGMMGSLMGLLPQPWRVYMQTGIWYLTILGTVRSDVLTCVFVLGVVEWWRGQRME